jgi:hypothetical protein
MDNLPPPAASDGGSGVINRLSFHWTDWTAMAGPREEKPTYREVNLEELTKGHAFYELPV